MNLGTALRTHIVKVRRHWVDKQAIPVRHWSRTKPWFFLEHHGICNWDRCGDSFVTTSVNEVIALSNLWSSNTRTAMNVGFAFKFAHLSVLSASIWLKPSKYRHKETARPIQGLRNFENCYDVILSQGFEPSNAFIQLNEATKSRSRVKRSTSYSYLNELFIYKSSDNRHQASVLDLMHDFKPTQVLINRY